MNYNMDYLEYQEIDGTLALYPPITATGKLAYNYKFQQQEHQEELGLNWDSFKYRNYMPDIGRFFNIDPLAEKYSYQSPYNFAENRVVNSRELEGLEAVKSIDGNTININVNVRIRNQTGNVFTNAQVTALAMQRKAQDESIYSGKDIDGHDVAVHINFSSKATLLWDYGTKIDPDTVLSLKGKSQTDKDDAAVWADGITDEIGNTQKNRTQVSLVAKRIGFEFDDKGQIIFDNTDAQKTAAEIGSHEDGHVFGLRHERKDSANTLAGPQAKDKKNVMNENVDGTNVLKEQRTMIVDDVPDKKLNQ